MSLLPNGHQSGLFVKAPLKAVADCLLQWDKELENGMVAESREIPLAEAWAHVDSDRTFIPGKAFLVGIGEWTAYFDNHSREFVAGSILAELCRRLMRDTCFYSFDDRTPEMEGSSEFCHYRSQGAELPMSRRQVMVTHDGGWKFEEFGDPLPYEQLDKYKLRRKADRLNPEIMRAYGEALRIPFWDESAYGNKVVLLKWGNASTGDAAASFQRIVAAVKKAGIRGKLTWLTRRAN